MSILSKLVITSFALLIIGTSLPIQAENERKIVVDQKQLTKHSTKINGKKINYTD